MSLQLRYVKKGENVLMIKIIHTDDTICLFF